MFAGAFAVGITVLSVIAITTDSRSHERTADGDLRRLTSNALLTIGDTTKGIDATGFGGLEIDEGSELIVFQGTAGEIPAVLDSKPKRRALRVDATDLAARAIDSYETQGAATVTGDGIPLRMRADPFGTETASNGAIVAIIDVRSGQAEHNSLMVAVVLATIALVTVFTGVGYALAGRSIRPALRSLQQQEHFLADAAHELRGPVAALRTSVEAGIASGRAEEVLPGMLTVSVHASELIDDLLTLARIDSGVGELTLEEVRLDLLVEDIAAQFDSAELITTPSIVRADVSLLRRAITNLVSNAMRHGQGREVTVRVEAGTVTVADRGPGVDPELIDQVFDRFAADPRSKGAGLGLAITRAIMGAHGGGATARNRPDGPGAEFELTLPPV